MGPGTGIAFFLLVLILIVVVAYVGWVQAEKRRAALRVLARELDLRYSATDDTTHDEVYDHFETFRRGHSRAAFNTLSGILRVGNDGYKLKAGDFRYKVTTSTNRGSSTSTYTFSYAIVHLPWVQAPSLLVRPEHIFDKIAGAIGFDDIDFESEEFSRRFHVKSSDKRFAYAILHPRMMEFLLPRLHSNLDFEQGRVLLTDGSRCWKPREFAGAFAFLRRYVELWPEHVVADLERGLERKH